MSKYNLIIDTREHKLIALLKETTIKGFSIKTEALKIGDIVIQRNVDEPISNSNTVFIFERKTCEDLLSSINDGRYREQKARLLSNFSKDKITYIIEDRIGDKLNRYRKNGKNSVIGAMTNCLLRDNIKILRTDSLDETVVFLLNICKKCDTNPEFGNIMDNPSPSDKELDKGSNIEVSSSSSPQKSSYIDTIKVDKKDNITPEVYGIISLSIIPGVSKKMAKCIIDKYGSFINLVHMIRCSSKDDVNDNSSNKSTCKDDDSSLKIILKELSGISIPITGGKHRKLGPVISKRIIEYLDIK